MTQEQDIVERLTGPYKYIDATNPNHDPYVTIHVTALREAAQTIAELRAERDYAVSEMKEAQEYMRIETAHAEAAEARVKQLEDECDQQCARRIEQMERGNTAIHERDEARAALDDVVSAWEALPGGRQQSVRDVEKWLANDMAPSINRIRDLRRARAALGDKP